MSEHLDFLYSQIQKAIIERGSNNVMRVLGMKTLAVQHHTLVRYITNFMLYSIKPVAINGMCVHYIYRGSFESSYQIYEILHE